MLLFDVPSTIALCSCRKRVLEASLFNRQRQGRFLGARLYHYNEDVRQQVIDFSVPLLFIISRMANATTDIF
jgi:hypothetical protein